MRRAAAAVLLLVAMAGACRPGGSIPDVDALVWYLVLDEEVRLGAGFPLTVTRIWRQDVDPDPWDDAILAPLVVRLEDKTRRENSMRVEEVRTYRAYAFERGEIVVPPRKVSARPKAGGPVQTLMTPEIKLRVKPELDLGNMGTLELPAEIDAQKRRWPVWLGVLVAFLAVGGVMLRTMRRRPAPEPPAGTTARDRARSRLQSLRGREIRTPAEAEAWALEASSALRDYMADGLSIRALEMTTEDVLASEKTAAAADPRARQELGSALFACDLVKFARKATTPADREAVLASGEAFIDATRGAPAP